MFFDGDLQSGIALALRKSQAVACFVKGDDEQSFLWENTYFKDDQVKLALTTRAVSLRIIAGSQEAGYLSAYYPIPTVPAMVIIRNGQPLLNIKSGESKESLKAAILRTLVELSPHVNANLMPTSSAILASTTTTENEPTDPQETLYQHTSYPPTPNEAFHQDPLTLAQPLNAAQAAASPPTIPPTTSDSLRATSPPSNPSATRSSQTVQNLLADRRRRLELDKKEKEAAEAAMRKTQAEARQAAMVADPNSAKAKQASYAQNQRKRQFENKLERERILKQIEHDKAERKEKELQRKALIQEEQKGSDGAGGLVDDHLSSEISCRSTLAKKEECAIQVRMFDGSTIRGRFPSDQTLRSNIRPWVDRERSDGDHPYNFKQILAPMSNRPLSISDEEESLQSLGLAPSGTLVIIPVQGYTAAYIADQGILSKGAAIGLNAVSAGAGIISGALGTVLGFGTATAPANNPSVREVSPQGPSSDTIGAVSNINIRTLHDQPEDQEDHQLYNGNQLNFEPHRIPDDRSD